MLKNYNCSLQFFLIILYSINLHNFNGSTDSLLTKGAAARGNDSEYNYNLIQSMKDIYGELKKLRNGGKINSDNIRMINANIVIRALSMNELDTLIAENYSGIIALRNYLKNSADEQNIQAIKKTFTIHRIEVDDIIAVHVKRNGGADFYFYKQK